MAPRQGSGEGSTAAGDGTSGSGGSADVPPLPGLPLLGEDHDVVEAAVRGLQMRIESLARLIADIRREEAEMQAETSLLERENARLRDRIAEERASLREAQNALRERNAADGAAGGSREFPAADSSGGRGAGVASASSSSAGLPHGRALTTGGSTSTPAEQNLRPASFAKGSGWRVFFLLALFVLFGAVSCRHEVHWPERHDSSFLAHALSAQRVHRRLSHSSGLDPHSPRPPIVVRLGMPPRSASHARRLPDMPQRRREGLRPRIPELRHVPVTDNASLPGDRAGVDSCSCTSVLCF